MEKMSDDGKTSCSAGSGGSDGAAISEPERAAAEQPKGKSLWLTVLFLGLYIAVDVLKNRTNATCVKGTTVLPQSLPVAVAIASLTLSTVLASIFGGMDHVRQCFDLRLWLLNLPSALFFAFSQSMAVLQMVFLSAGMAKITQQVRLPLNVFLAYFVSGRHHTFRQIVAVIMLALSVALFQLSNGETSSASSTAGDQRVGVVLSLLGSLGSVLGCLMSEKIMKKDVDMPFYLQKFHQEVGGLLVSVSLLFLLPCLGDLIDGMADGGAPKGRRSGNSNALKNSLFAYKATFAVRDDTEAAVNALFDFSSAHEEISFASLAEFGSDHRDTVVSQLKESARDEELLEFSARKGLPVYKILQKLSTTADRVRRGAAHAPFAKIVHCAEGEELKDSVAVSGTALPLAWRGVYEVVGHEKNIFANPEEPTSAPSQGKTAAFGSSGSPAAIATSAATSASKSSTGEAGVLVASTTSRQSTPSMQEQGEVLSSRSSVVEVTEKALSLESLLQAKGFIRDTGTAAVEQIRKFLSQEGTTATSYGDTLFCRSLSNFRQACFFLEQRPTTELENTEPATSGAFSSLWPTSSSRGGPTNSPFWVLRILGPSPSADGTATLNAESFAVSGPILVAKSSGGNLGRIRIEAGRFALSKSLSAFLETSRQTGTTLVLQSSKSGKFPTSALALSKIEKMTTSSSSGGAATGGAATGPTRAAASTGSYGVSSLLGNLVSGTTKTPTPTPSSTSRVTREWSLLTSSEIQTLAAALQMSNGEGVVDEAGGDGLPPNKSVVLSAGPGSSSSTSSTTSQQAASNSASTQPQQDSDPFAAIVVMQGRVAPGLPLGRNRFVCDARRCPEQDFRGYRYMFDEDTAARFSQGVLTGYERGFFAGWDVPVLWTLLWMLTSFWQAGLLVKNLSSLWKNIGQCVCTVVLCLWEVTAVRPPETEYTVLQLISLTIGAFVVVSWVIVFGWFQADQQSIEAAKTEQAMRDAAEREGKFEESSSSLGSFQNNQMVSEDFATTSPESGGSGRKQPLLTEVEMQGKV
ncbi:unnamed protein product [Amoebophrya sp. A25]|nr:unnamed protein product [Amoebophrya sp. A25]|eukprot:GSA25T00015823001.1